MSIIHERNVRLDYEGFRDDWRDGLRNFACVKFPQTQFETLCLWYAFEEFKQGPYYDSNTFTSICVRFVNTAGLDTFVGVYSVTKINCDDFCKHIKPLGFDIAPRHHVGHWAAHRKDCEDVWRGNYQFDGLLPDLVERVLNISNADKASFCLEYELYRKGEGVYGVRKINSI